MKHSVEESVLDVANEAVRPCWQVITCEYPPQTGGVSDYTRAVAAGLAAQGDEVHVWCPQWDGTPSQADGFAIHRELGAFRPADLRRVGRKLDRFPAPHRILVQWVPHGYGYRSMNVAFCWWLWNRARQGDRVELMVHEPYLPFHRTSVRQNVAALAHRLMTILLLRAASHVWVSIPEWERRLRPYALGRPVPVQWLPIPSSIPMICSTAGAQAVRKRYDAEHRVLIGHFGTFGWPITPMLEEILLALTGELDAQAILLMGLKSEEFRQALIKKEPRLAEVVHATGTLSAEDLSCHLAACDLLIQPYPDGVSTRRTSFMAGLSHGRPIVTTTGASTESLWRQTDAVALAAVNDVATFLGLLRKLRSDTQERGRMGEAASKLYRERFDVCHAVTELRSASGALQHSVCAS